MSQSCRETEEHSNIYVECECKDAQERIGTGEIEKCGDEHQCPPGCAVCEICLKELVTCPPKD